MRDPVRHDLGSDRSTSTDHREVPAGPAGDGYVPIDVGAVHGHSGAGQSIHQDRVGMSVVVARSDRDQRHPSLGRGKKRRPLIGAAVVGHLQHVGREVDTSPQHITLRLVLDVPGRQYRTWADGDPRDDGGVVGIRPGAEVACHRPEDVDPRGVDHPDLPRSEREHSYPGSGRDPADLGGHVVGRRIGTRRDGAHRPTVQHAGQAPNMVGVQMREHEHGYGRDTEPA